MNIREMSLNLHEIYLLLDIIRTKCVFLDKYSDKDERIAIYKQIGELQELFSSAVRVRSIRVNGVRHKINAIKHTLSQWIRNDEIYEQKAIKRLSRLFR